MTPALFPIMAQKPMASEVRCVRSDHRTFPPTVIERAIRRTRYGIEKAYACEACISLLSLSDTMICKCLMLEL